MLILGTLPRNQFRVIKTVLALPTMEAFDTLMGYGA
jgi:hypothetical protein